MFYIVSKMLSSFTTRLAKMAVGDKLGKSMKSPLGRPFRKLLGSLTVLGLVSTNASCADEKPGARNADAVGSDVANDSVRLSSSSDSSYSTQSKELLDGIRAKGVKDELVLNALASVPRHIFVSDELKSSSYDDNPLPIGGGQTISQPFIVAYMTESLRLKGNERVLEIGTGSGYQAAVLSRLVKHVYSIEIIPELAEKAKKALTACGITNVSQKVGDGYQGWIEEAPFDAVIITAAPPAIPSKLVEQLKVGGVLLAPVGESSEAQWLVRLTKQADGSVEKETLMPVRFVPMVPGASSQESSGNSK